MTLKSTRLSKSVGFLAREDGWEAGRLVKIVGIFFFLISKPKFTFGFLFFFF